MRPAIFAAALALASPTLATPVTARDDCSSDPTVFRFLFGAYCLVDSTLPSNGPCEDLNEQVKTNLSSANPVVELDVNGHNVTLTFEPQYFYGAASVTIDNVLRNATGQNDPTDLFGPGITRSYDYPLESAC